MVAKRMVVIERLLLERMPDGTCLRTLKSSNIYALGSLCKSPPSLCLLLPLATQEQSPPWIAIPTALAAVPAELLIQLSSSPSSRPSQALDIYPSCCRFCFEHGFPVSSDAAGPPLRAPPVVSIRRKLALDVLEVWESPACGIGE